MLNDSCTVLPFTLATICLHTDQNSNELFHRFDVLTPATDVFLLQIWSSTSKSSWRLDKKLCSYAKPPTHLSNHSFMNLTFVWLLNSDNYISDGTWRQSKPNPHRRPEDLWEQSQTRSLEESRDLPRQSSDWTEQLVSWWVFRTFWLIIAYL